MSGRRRVLIVGCGYVGTALGEALTAKDGDQVFGLRRNPSKLPPSITGVAADLRDEATFDAIPEGIEDVVITASPGGGSDDDYRAAYVDGPRALLRFLNGRGDALRRVLLTTSTGVYGQTDGSWVDEDSPTEPTHHSGQRMLEGEALLRGGVFDGVAVRLSGIYGPGRTRLIDRVRDGDARTPRDTRWTNRIHRDDCAGILRHLLNMEETPPEVIIGVDPEPVGLGEVQRFLASELGVREPPLEDEGSAAAVGRRARSNKRCRSLYVGPLGYEFEYPSFREGYRAMLADLLHDAP